MWSSFWKRSLVFGIILLFVGISIYPINFQAESIKTYSTIYIDDSNTAGPWDGTLTHPYQHIQDGINAANPSDTVFVYSGTYYEHVVVDKAINLIGENKNTSIIKVTDIGNVITIGTNNVKISNFTIQNSNLGYTAGIYLTLCEYIDVINNNIEGNFFGIQMCSHYVRIIDNDFRNNALGVFFQTLRQIGAEESWNNFIYHNNFYNCGAYAYLNFVIWDNGYPSGGNYWGGYSGSDIYKGPNQNMPGSDGIIDTPYSFSDNQQDNYPFIEPINRVQLPPVANADGPYSSNEGSQILFNASLSSDPQDDTLQYRWDFDSDGIWDIAYSLSPMAIHTWYDDFIGFATVEVFDGKYTNIDTAEVTVTNVAPTVIIDEINPEYDRFILIGDTIDFIGSFFDPGTLDTHIIEWDFGDGYKITNTLTPVYNYLEPGVYNVFLNITDDDGGQGTTSTIIHILSQQEATDDIIDDILDMNLSDGLTNSFVSKLENIKNSLNKGNIIPAITQLNAFINQVEAQRGKELTDEQADILISEAQWIIDNLLHPEIIFISIIKRVINFVRNILK